MRGVLTAFCVLGLWPGVLAQTPAATEAREDSPPAVVYYDQRDDGAIGWDDFKGTAPTDADVEEEAEIAWGIQFSDWTTIETKDDEGCTAKPKAGTLKIRAFMIPKESWVKPGAKTPLLLRHEQGHFHIAHVYAQLLQRRVDELIRKGELAGKGRNCAAARRALQRVVEELVDRCTDKCDEIQKLYDKETEHGTDPNRQATWDRKIEAWLEKPADAPQP